ncbi:MAG: hypothetical protein ACYCT9_08830 [Leptospirillum sp.]|jgi:hypothetical protein
MIEVSTDRLKMVAKTLIENSDISKGVWPGIQSPDPTQKEANKFFLTINRRTHRFRLINTLKNHPLYFITQSQELSF